METKALNIEIKDAAKGIVRAVFAHTGEKDKHNDWTLPGAFGEQKVRISAYGHMSTRLGALPVGKGTIKEVGNQAVADLHFFLNTSAGREHFEVIKEMGELQEWSYGFAVKETGEVTEELQKVGVERVLQKLEVHEVSPVLIGAGYGTHTLGVKADDGEADPEADTDLPEVKLEDPVPEPSPEAVMKEQIALEVARFEALKISARL